MRRHRAVVAWVAAVLLASGDAFAQRVAVDAIRVGDPGAVHTLELRDGSTLVGTILAVTPESVRIEMKYGTLDVARTDILAVRKSNGHKAPGGAVWPENPAGTRLLIGPTALPLEKGEATLADVYLQDHGDTQAVISYGFRILGERLAADVAFFNATDSEAYFPGIPFVGITMKH